MILFFFCAAFGDGNGKHMFVGSCILLCISFVLLLTFINYKFNFREISRVKISSVSINIVSITVFWENEFAGLIQIA